MNTFLPLPPARPKGRAAFTLPEMLTVVFIVSALAAFLVTGAITVRRRARQTKCMENLSALGREMTMYAAERDGRMVDAYDPDPEITEDARRWWYVEMLAFRMQTRRESIDLNTPPESAQIFRCPSDRDYAFTRDRLSYGLNADVMYDENHATYPGLPYTFDRVATAPPDSDDKQPDSYNIDRIVNKAQFILAADTGPITLHSGDPTNRNYRSWIGPPRLGTYPNTTLGGNAGYRPISGPHSGQANVLFADGHVEEVDFGQFDPPRDNFPTSDRDWFRQWTLGNQ